MNNKTMQLYTQLGELFEKKLGTDLFNSVGNLIAHLTPIFLISFTTYVVLIFWEYRNEGFSDLVIDLSKKMIFWLVLTAFAFNSTNYIHLANVIYNAPNEVAGWFLNGSSAKLDSNFFEQASMPLDDLLTKVNQYYNSLGWTNLGSLIRVSITHVVINILGNIFISVTFGLYMICRVLLAITIMIGPIFLGFLLFSPTRQWGMNWVSQIINCLLTAVLYMITIILFITFFKAIVAAFVIDVSKEDSSVELLIDGALSFIIGITFIFLLVLFKLPAIASSLVGGASLEGVFSGGIRSIETSASIIKQISKGLGIIGTKSNIKKDASLRDQYRKFKSNSIKPGGK